MANPRDPRLATSPRSDPGFLPLSSEMMQALGTVLARAEKRFLHKNGVRKVEIGFIWMNGTMTDRLGVRLYREVKNGEEPQDGFRELKIGDYPVDVFPIVHDYRFGLRFERVLGGATTRNINLQIGGTLGAVVFDKRSWHPMAISAYHVLVGIRPGGAVGEPVQQPASRLVKDRVGTVARSSEGLDCAVAQLSLLDTSLESAPRAGLEADHARRISTSILGVPGGIKGVVEPSIGMQVLKYGPGTQLTQGIIESVGRRRFTIAPVPGRWMDLSRAGDSGAVWLEASSHAAVGLHVRGEVSEREEDERAYATRIDQIAKDRKLRIALCRQHDLTARSSTSPALATWGDRMVLAWVDRQTSHVKLMELFWRTFKLHQSREKTLNTRSEHAPRFAFFRGRMFLACVDLEQRALRIHSSADGSGWGRGYLLHKTSSSSPPALARLGDKLGIAWRDAEDNSIRISTSRDGKKWSKGITIDIDAASGPALAAVGGHPVIAWRAAVDNRIHIMQGNRGLSFWNVTRPYKASSDPCLHVHQGRLFLAWRGEDGRLQVCESHDAGKTWRNRLTLRHWCNGGPVLGTYGEDLVWAWANGSNSSGSVGQVKLLLYDLWQPEASKLE